MNPLAKWIAKLGGAAEHEADALRLRKLLREVSRKEGPLGEPFLDLAPGKVLRRDEFTPLGPDHYEELWHPTKLDADGGSPFGFFRTSAAADGKHGAMMDGAMIDYSHQGKGLGKAAYRALADHYGGVHSSDFETSDAARRIYRSLGAKPMAEKNIVGQPLERIEGRDKGPRWGIFEDEPQQSKPSALARFFARSKS